MSDRLSTAEASELTGVPQPTIKHWLGQGVPIPAEKDSAGRWRFGPEAVAVLQAVKGLRDQDRTFDTIRRRLEPELTAGQREMSQGLALDEPLLIRSERELTVDDCQPMVDERTLAETLAAAVTPQLVEALAAQNDLAEKYARAAHNIGTLEERVLNLTVQLSDERNRHARELIEAKDKIALLEAPAAIMVVRPWWKLWG